jgi:hypothetical protein
MIAIVTRSIRNEKLVTIQYTGTGLPSKVMNLA